MVSYHHDGLPFEVSDSGPQEGDLVIALHGFPETCRSWDALTPLLTGPNTTRQLSLACSSSTPRRTESARGKSRERPSPGRLTPPGRRSPDRAMSSTSAQ